MKFSLPAFLTTLTALSLVGLSLTSAQEEIPQENEILTTLKLSLDGVERTLSLKSGESALTATVNFLNSIMGEGSAVDANNQPFETTVQIAELLVKQLNEVKEKKPSAPLVSFEVQTSDTTKATFEHFADADLQADAGAFCAKFLPGMPPADCSRQIIVGAQNVYTSKLKAPRNVVFTTPVSVEGVDLMMSVAENENGSEAADFFCKSLTVGDRGLGPNELNACRQGVTTIAEARITEYMSQQQKRQEVQKTLFQIPIKIGEETLPLAFSLNENPKLTTARFCNDQWAYISTVLASSDEKVEISKAMCENTLDDIVRKMVGDVYSSEEGKALLEEQKLFSVSVELGDEPNVQVLALNVLKSQTSAESVDHFLRVTGISQNAREALVQVVDQEFAKRQQQSTPA